MKLFPDPLTANLPLTIRQAHTSLHRSGRNYMIFGGIALLCASVGWGLASVVREPGLLIFVVMSLLSLACFVRGFQYYNQSTSLLVQFLTSKYAAKVDGHVYTPSA